MQIRKKLRAGDIAVKINNDRGTRRRCMQETGGTNLDADVVVDQVTRDTGQGRELHGTRLRFRFRKLTEHAQLRAKTHGISSISTPQLDAAEYRGVHTSASSIYPHLGTQSTQRDHPHSWRHRTLTATKCQHTDHFHAQTSAAQIVSPTFTAAATCSLVTFEKLHKTHIQSATSQQKDSSSAQREMSRFAPQYAISRALPSAARDGIRWPCFSGSVSSHPLHWKDMKAKSDEFIQLGASMSTKRLQTMVSMQQKRRASSASADRIDRTYRSL